MSKSDLLFPEACTCKPYTVQVFSKNPATRSSDQADYVFHADTKRSLIGILKTIADNFDFEHVAIWRE